MRRSRDRTIAGGTFGRRERGSERGERGRERKTSRDVRRFAVVGERLKLRCALLLVNPDRSSRVCTKSDCTQRKLPLICTATPFRMIPSRESGAIIREINGICSVQSTYRVINLIMGEYYMDA